MFCISKIGASSKVQSILGCHMREQCSVLHKETQFYLISLFSMCMCTKCIDKCTKYHQSPSNNQEWPQYPGNVIYVIIMNEHSPQLLIWSIHSTMKMLGLNHSQYHENAIFLCRILKFKQIIFRICQCKSFLYSWI